MPRKRMPRTAAGVAAVACVALLAGACGAGPQPGIGLEREVRGDTTIVRLSGTATEVGVTEEIRIGSLDGADEYTFGNVAGMVAAADGTIYVVDSQAREIRVYDAGGQFVRRFGGAGGGPGELQQPSAIAFLPDGRLVVRDYRNARINVYSAGGEVLTSWPIPGGFFTSSPMFVDDRGSVYTDIIADRSGPGIGRIGLLRLDGTGAVVDTLVRPLEEVDGPRLEAVSASGNARAVYTVPFWPGAVSTLNRQGEFVGGINDRYAVHTWRLDGTVQRIERDMAPVPVQAAEAATAVERTTRGLRNTQPDWRWNGPRPPENKPYFRSIRVAADGRMWVQLSQTAERRDPDPDAQPDAQGQPPLELWVEPSVYDVYEADGTFVATVRLPDRFSMMYMEGQHVWGVIRDDFDVPYVARFRIATTQ